MTRIEVCVLPGRRAARWHTAIVEVAQVLGSQVEVIFSQIEHRPLDSQCDHITLLSETSEEIVCWVRDVASISFADACRHASMLLAKAAVLGESGVDVRRQDAEEIEITGLGVVRMPQDEPDSVRSTTTPLSFYDTLPLRGGRTIDWPDEVFLGEEPFLSRKQGALRCDLTGRSRVLRYGPYFHLAPGLWTICARIAIQIEGGAADLRFEWGVDHDVTTVTQTVERSGVYEVILSKLWAEAAPSELRVWLDRAMFAGAFEVQSCNVRLGGADQTD